MILSKKVMTILMEHEIKETFFVMMEKYLTVMVFLFKNIYLKNMLTLDEDMDMI